VDHLADFPPLDAGAAGFIRVTPIDHFVVTFPGTNGAPVYAQLFVANVTLIADPTKSAILSRGHEINPVEDVLVRYRFLNAVEVPNSPDVPHAHACTIGSIKTDIITHKLTTESP
jgi:hypothetical protein